MNSCQLQAMEEEFRFRLKHQRLIQEFLDLQKDFVSKKKKIQIMAKKRDVLLAEVRFLRQKHSYLMDLHSENLESNQEFVSPEKSSVQDENVCRSLEEVAEKEDQGQNNH